MSDFFDEPVPVYSETGNVYVSHEEAADLFGLGLITWGEDGEWRSRVTGVELLTALEGL